MICPVCITSAAIVAGSVTSGGSAFALIVARFPKLTGFLKHITSNQGKEKHS